MIEVLNVRSPVIQKSTIDFGDGRQIRHRDYAQNNCKSVDDFYRSIQSIPVQCFSDHLSMPITWNISGWIRIYCGPYRDVIDSDEQSRMVHIGFNATTENIVQDMDIPKDYTIWMQIGGATTQRLHNDEHPFQLQDNFLRKIGYTDASRRARLCIDPDLKYLIRFYLGPANISQMNGAKHSGTVDILKGLVFPQWKKRSIAVVGNFLFVFPGNNSTTPEIFDMSGGHITDHSPGYNRLIIKIVPSTTAAYDIRTGGMGSSTATSTSVSIISNAINDHININNNDHCHTCIVDQQLFTNNNGDNSAMFQSTCSINSTSDREKILFFGFEESWERDLWSSWLSKATTHIKDDKKVDLCGSGLQAIPEIVFQSMDSVEELLAGQNKLQEIGLKALADLRFLKILRLPGNGFKEFPLSLLELTGLTVLDLDDNEIEEIPHDIHRLKNLEELWVERNCLKELPYSLKKLRNLESLQLSQNNLNKLPAFFVKMKTIGLTEMYCSKPDFKQDNNRREYIDQNHLNPPLTKVSLRANQLQGSIILGNYGHLTQLDVSENDIEILDLSALDKLENLQCSKNRLKEIILNGRVLRSLIATNNDLTKISIDPEPKHLHHLDISFNKITDLPEWIYQSEQLLTLFAGNNCLTQLPHNFFMNESISLHTLQLECNQINELPTMPTNRSIPLRQLFLQNNQIEELPENMFIACDSLICLNISSNKLMFLPSFAESRRSTLERLYGTNNRFTDRILDTLIFLNQLKIVHLAYNKMTTFPETCISNWPNLEELILSGNRLQHLPDNLVNMEHLKVLRVHSNQLQSVPLLSRINSLRVLDLAHNQLDKINLTALVSKKLRFLDLSCNVQLQVDPNQFQACRSQRQMSLVDVSGKNRVSLPTQPDLYQECAEYEPPWKLGFSETSGMSSKLYVSQLRLPCFCNSEGLFGIFDGEIDRIVPNELVKIVPKILLEERTVKETVGDYMKYTLLSAHRELKQLGQKQGVSAILCHISLQRDSKNSPFHSSPNSPFKRRFILRIASVGEAAAILIRQTGNLKLTPATPKRQIGNSSTFPHTIPDPEMCEIPLGDQDEYLVIANKKLWDVMDADAVAKEIRCEANVILASKRIQDVAQSYGIEENLSVIIVKFNNLGTNADHLMRELRQTIGKKSPPFSGFCKCGCCCESNNNCCHSAASAGLQFIRQSSNRSDRSSPSGQSDNTGSELSNNFYKKSCDISTIASRKSLNHTINERKSLRGGVVRAVRAKIEEEKQREREESDSALSEEQFKCWEYMLEQNTQLLFDKELNTISKAFTKNLQSNQSNLRASISGKPLSLSTPQLTINDHNPKPVMSQYHELNGSGPLLSRQFGSARSFHPQAPSLLKSLRFSSTRHPHINSGPNAAYFGSLQRLMPYNLEYDFALMHERRSDMESLDYENRMQQYWGVATTEL